jgi:hypothetical protein
MNASSSSSRSSDQGWKDLYISALFESDKSKMANKITQAQTAIAFERRRLMALDNDVHERQRLDNALFSLRALRSCLSIPSSTNDEVNWFRPRSSPF